MARKMQKHMKVKLKTIKCSNNIDVLSLQSNYSTAETLNDLDTVIGSPEFNTCLSTTPQCFDICVDSDDLIVNSCPECAVDACESLERALKQGIESYRNLYIMHWMSKGNDMMKLHLLCEELYEELIKEIDILGELMVEKCGKVIDFNFTCNYLEIRNYEFQESLQILKSLIQSYIDTLDYAYPNQTSDVQSVMDEWLRYWNKQMNYFVKRQEA